MPPRRLLAALLALALAGCGAAPSSAGDFEGEERDVAQVVEDLQAAGQAKDAGEICGRLLAAELVDALAAPGRSCTQEVDKALEDSDNFAVDVKDVTVAGSTATARVEDADEKPRELRLVKSGTTWKISALGA